VSAVTVEMQERLEARIIRACFERGIVVTGVDHRLGSTTLTFRSDAAQPPRVPEGFTVVTRTLRLIQNDLPKNVTIREALAADLARVDGDAEQLKQVLNALSQNANQISTALGAGTSEEAGADALGPNWKPGKDGAQDPKALLKQMKKQEARELRQERQANEQILEQQQLDYEKEVISNLGQQKPAIQKKKNQLEEVRKENNAN
jgi:hypothetical protein